MKRFAAVIALLVAALTCTANASGACWQLMDEQGKHQTTICYEPDAGDTYLAEDNHLYTVVRVDGGAATLHDEGAFTMPDVSWLDSADAAQLVSAMPFQRHIAFYCTHSDESYEPTDGYYSTTKRGSIYQVAQLLAQELTDSGVRCEVSDQLHHPHDAGAYRRSRQTAMQLVKSMPDAIFDIHRDGIPDPAEYTAVIGGNQVSRIRLLVGRGNQNMEVNKTFALTLKAVADKVYPKLIKDIYIGRGVFNQDLLPKALLLECGTYTLPRETVDASMPMLADVIYRTLYGGQVASRDGRLAQRTQADPNDVMPGVTDPPVQPMPGEGRAAAGGMVWLVGLIGVGLIVFGLVQTGTIRGSMHKTARHLNEMTGGLLGKKPTPNESDKQDIDKP